jgi:GTP pyrophosphokinase
MQAGRGLINLEEINKIQFRPKNQNVFIKYLKMPFVGNQDTKQAQTVPIDGVPINKIDRKKTLILTEEYAGTVYHLADCCKPIPGDDVLGYVDDSENLMIHKRECPKAALLKTSFGKRLVSVDWATHKGLSFIQTLEIKGIDKQGVMIEILKVISEKFGGNISKITIETNDGIFVGYFSISVHDTEDIELLCKNISKIAEINSVQRV